MLKAKRSSPFGSLNLSLLKNVKFWGIFVFLVILAGLPVALYEVQQQQSNQQHAQFLRGQQTYYCNSNLTVVLSPVSETPAACSNGSYSGVTSYTSSIKLTAQTGSSGSYTLHWNWATFFCQVASTSPCLLSGSGTAKSVPFTGSSSITMTSDTRQPPASFSGQACGVYQNDFGFYITDNSGRKLCTSIVDLSPNGLGVINNNASWCSSGKNCTTVLPSPTPTHIPTPTPTGAPTATPTLPVDTPTETPPPSATPTSSPSATPTFTITPTFTVTPTGTLTPTQSPTPTPTGAPTDTPVPGTSPTPTIIVVRPTLPPTGPSNTLVVIGLVGVAISVLGMALLIGI